MSSLPKTYPAESRLRFEPRPFCANHSATEPPDATAVGTHKGSRDCCRPMAMTAQRRRYPTACYMESDARVKLTDENKWENGN